MTLVQTPFKLTPEEVLTSAAATLCLLALEKAGETETAVGEIASAPQYGFTASAATEPVGPRFLRITDIKGGIIDWQRVPFCECPNPSGYELAPDDILVARAGSIGKSFIVTSVPDAAVFASYMIRLRTRSGTIPSYLYWCLQSQQFWRQIMTASRGSAMENINGKMLAALRFPHPSMSIQQAIVGFLEAFRARLLGEDRILPALPPPLAEQQRIVARIEALAARIAEARGLRQAAVEETEALMGATIADLFARGKEQRWKAGRLGDYVIDDCYGTSEKANGDESGTPILRMGNIQDGRLDLRDLKYLQLNDKDRARLMLCKGDILVNRTNSAELVGKCAVFTIEGEYSFASYLIRLRLDIARAEPKLVASFINSPIGRAYMFDQRKQMTGQANVNATKLKALPLALPHLPEQRRIVAYLDDLQARVGALQELQAATAAELDALLPAVLDKAFRGEL